MTTFHTLTSRSMSTAALTSPPAIVSDVQGTVINMESNGQRTSSNLETIKNRLGDIAACKTIIRKTKNSLFTASDSLHMEAGDLEEFSRAKSLIDALLPTVEMADGHSQDACKSAADLLRSLKEFASRMHASPLSLSSELKRPETEHIMSNSTSLKPNLLYVQESMKEAIDIIEKPEKELQELNARAQRVAKYIFFAALGFLVLLGTTGRAIGLPFLGCLMILIGVSGYFQRLSKVKKLAIMKGEREQAIRKEANTSLKRVQLISTHVASLGIPERINAELGKSTPFGLPAASEGWLKVADDLQETIAKLEED